MSRTDALFSQLLSVKAMATDHKPQPKKYVQLWEKHNAHSMSYL